MRNMENAVVVSKKWGEGVISSVVEKIDPKTGESSGKITVRFEKEEKTFQLWIPFVSKTLVFKDLSLQNEAEQIILHNQKAAAQAQNRKQKEEEEQKLHEEEAKLQEKKEREERMKLFSPGQEAKYSREKLEKAVAAGQVFSYLPFSGHRKTQAPSKYMFSNWYPCEFVVDGVTYHTTEQFMMAQKALLFEDYSVYEKIMASENPKEYKALGRLVKNFDGGVWNDYKYSIVLEGCKAKFSQNEDFKQFLLGTGDAVIIEAAKWDDIWGIKLAPEDPRVNDPFQWQGSNLLGFILMETRDFLREK